MLNQDEYVQKSTCRQGLEGGIGAEAHALEAEEVVGWAHGGKGAVLDVLANASSPACALSSSYLLRESQAGRVDAGHLRSLLPHHRLMMLCSYPKLSFALKCKRTKLFSTDFIVQFNYPWCKCPGFTPLL